MFRVCQAFCAVKIRDMRLRCIDSVNHPYLRPKILLLNGIRGNTGFTASFNFFSLLIPKWVRPMIGGFVFSYLFMAGILETFSAHDYRYPRRHKLQYFVNIWMQQVSCWTGANLSGRIPRIRSVQDFNACSAESGTMPRRRCCDPRELFAVPNLE
ncbi:hypothetical protein M431DRAFT_414787 [Trichoderma harzianum CBS 226.95]|uniref:Uncharacterized protein n=1 Tax=Trichoderma harzianum CBS 226.95 TaxID=983964 RepID=A0A2T4AFZ7_TRIHA|nr:hypothetical protein M431DRAFT_414787 [Trichoderma harzianum CBS 226.95]PTB55986.1 hypothetical protein M431DRAFT_414787 [Trichoderma harzianum CBS 226.95]